MEEDKWFVDEAATIINQLASRARGIKIIGVGHGGFIGAPLHIRVEHVVGVYEYNPNKEEPLFSGGVLTVPDDAIPIPEDIYRGELKLDVNAETMKDFRQAYEDFNRITDEYIYIIQNFRLKMDTIDAVLIADRFQERIYPNTIRTNYKSPHRKPPFTRRGHRQSYKPSG
jgi:hypothetical protein